MADAFRLFALNRQNESDQLASLAMGAWGDQSSAQAQPVQPLPSQGTPPMTPGGFPVFQPQPVAPPPAPPQAAFPGMTTPTSAPSPILNKALAGESGGDFDALYGFSNRDGGPFAGVKPSTMTVRQWKEFQNPNGPYGQWVKAHNNGVLATPMGGLQIVGKTFNDAVDKVGLKDDDIMTPENQMKVGQHILETQGPSAWEALKGGVSKLAGLPPIGHVKANTDMSDLEKDLPDMSPEAQKKRKISMVLTGLGRGLSQMSGGQDVDLTDVISDYQDRQDKMRERLMEIAQEKERRVERAEDRNLTIDQANQQNALTVGQFNAGAENQVNLTAAQLQAAEENQNRQIQAAKDLQESGQLFTTSERKDTHAQTQEDIKAERDRLATAAKTSIKLMYPNSAFGETANSIAEVDPATAYTWAGNQHKLEETKASEAAMSEAFKEVPAAATAASQGDFDNATKIYTDATGAPPPAALLGKYMRLHPEDTPYILQSLRSQSGIADPYESKGLDVSVDTVKKLNENVISSQDQTRNMQGALQLAIDPSLNTGKFQEAILPFKQYLASVGIGDPESVNAQTLFQSISKGLISKMRSPGEGQMSDADSDRLEKAVSSVGKSKETNAALLYSQMEMARRQEAYANAYTDATFTKRLSGQQRTDYIEQQMAAQHMSKNDNVFKEIPEGLDGNLAAAAAKEIPIGTPYFLEGRLVIRGQE